MAPFTRTNTMNVVTRSGKKEKLDLNKVQSRLQNLCDDLNVDPSPVILKVVAGIYSGVTTVELDNLAAEVAASLTTSHPDYALFAGRIAMANLEKQTKNVFSEVMEDLYNNRRSFTGEHCPMISKDILDVVLANSDVLNAVIDYNRDRGYTYFGFKTLERSYLLKIDGKIVERPQHMLMRVAVGIHADDIPAAIETYNLMSEKWFTHASPTMFNAGT
uniref:Ribonucleoside-diphosphate reductase large subunit n=1 Tax=Panagrolaimus sp. JU765 TaxID=591449 RepID=A0AC34R226_9BILA